MVILHSCCCHFYKSTLCFISLVSLDFCRFFFTLFILFTYFNFVFYNFALWAGMLVNVSMQFVLVVCMHAFQFHLKNKLWCDRSWISKLVSINDCMREWNILLFFFYFLKSAFTNFCFAFQYLWATYIHTRRILLSPFDY